MKGEYDENTPKAKGAIRVKLNREMFSWGFGLYVDKNGDMRDPFVLEKKELAPTPKRPRRHAKKRARMKVALAMGR